MSKKNKNVSSLQFALTLPFYSVGERTYLLDCDHIICRRISSELAILPFPNIFPCDFAMLICFADSLQKKNLVMDIADYSSENSLIYCQKKTELTMTMNSSLISKTVACWPTIGIY